MRRTLTWQLSARQLFILALLLIGSAGFQFVALRHFLLSAAGTRLSAAVRQPMAAYQADVAAGTAPSTAAQDLVQAVADPSTLAWVIGPHGSVWAQATGPTPLSPPGRSHAPFAPVPGVKRPSQPPDPQPPGATISGEDLTLRVPLPTPGTPQHATLIVATPIQDVLGVLGSELRLLLVGGIAALVIGGLSGAWAVRQALRPLRAIRATADQIAAGSLDVRAGQADAPEEVAHLSRAFDAMVDRLAAAIEDERSTHQQMRRFLDDASHELRTPLTALTGTLEVLQGQAGTDPEALREGLRAVYRQARRLSTLVAGLLSLARAERPDGLPLVRTDIVDVLENIRLTVERLTADHRLEWVKPAVPLPVLADTTILGSAVLNVIENAVRYSPLDTPIRIAARSDHTVAEVAISDQGPGIPAECLPHVFDRFYRCRPAGSSPTEASQGTGLGLAIVRSVMLQHHGEATIDSIVHAGTTVRLRLPLCVLCSPEANSSDSTPGVRSSSAGPRTTPPVRSSSRSTAANRES